MPVTPARMREARGFTLIELLLVVLLIAILAAIAIPMFLGQSLKANDASAKSNVKVLSGMVEECRVETSSHDYTMCNSDAELDGTPGLDWGAGADQVGMIGSHPEIYIAYAVSKSKNGSNNHAFYIIRDEDRVSYRVCTPAGKGGCGSDSYW